MNFDGAAFGILLTLLPGITALMGFTAAARLRTLPTRDWFVLIALLVLPALPVHLATTWIVERLGVDNAWEMFLGLIGIVKAPALDTEFVDPARALSYHAALQMILSLVIGYVLGWTVSKATVWGSIQGLGELYYGPFFTFLAGFKRPFLYVSVLSRIGPDNAKVLYYGVLSGVVLRGDGQIAWITLWDAERTVLEIHGPTTAQAAYATISDAEPASLRSEMPFDDDRLKESLVIEGGTIENYHVSDLAALYNIEEPIKGVILRLIRYLVRSRYGVRDLLWGD